MDKLRAMQYFVTAAHEGSLSAAARRHDVSVNAVSKSIASLERSLGIVLFDRNSHGLALTVPGQEFLDGCAPALERIADAETAAGAARAQATGTVAIAIQHLLAQHCLGPALPRFHARLPNVQLELRDYQQTGDPRTDGADLRLAVTWHALPDETVRTIARTRLVVCATPGYWARHGIPGRPADLASHPCFALCAVNGTLMDHWPMTRDGEQESVIARSWLTTSNSHRDLIVEAVLAGEGVMRSIDIAIEAHLRSGRLVPVLTDWQTVDSPTVRLRYRPAAARLPRVRATIEFLTELFRDVERRCADLTGARPDAFAPSWVGQRFYRRASSAAMDRPKDVSAETSASDRSRLSASRRSR